jgi:prepilin-type N-terminal cleavage/methylation domain-containing protein
MNENILNERTMKENILNTGRSRLKLGFTLVEVLVVLLIVASLAVLSTLAVQRAIDAARKAKSVTNLRSLTNASLLYASDHDGRLPACIQANYPFAYVAPDYENPGSAKTGSFNAMAQYLGEKNYAVFCNPALLARLKCTPEESLFTEKGYWGTSYWYFGGNPKGYYNADPTIGTPIWEGSPERLNTSGRYLLIGDLSYHERSSVSLPMRPGCHVKKDKDGKLVTIGGNWAFLDGSVQWFSRAELTVEQNCGGQRLLRPDVAKLR